MKISPLQLDKYFVSDVHLSANKSFNPEKELQARETDLSIEVDSKRVGDDERRWQVVLGLKNQPAAEANLPYIFSVEIVGFFEVLAGYPRENIERLVRTNGPSMLFGVLREIVRDLTGRGPYFMWILPSVSFYEEFKKEDAVSAEGMKD